MRFVSTLLLCAIALGAALPAQARTEAMLQVDVEGRGGSRSNRLVLTDAAADGRDVMLVLSCTVGDKEGLGVALDFGAGDIWALEGEDVGISRDTGADLRQRMDSRGAYLTIGGKKAIALFRELLAGQSMAFVVRSRFTAAFELGEVSRHVVRFRQLCDWP